MKNQLPQTASTLKLLSGDLASNLSLNESQRRRIAAAQDPSLLFGTAVFAQMVAADLARGASESVTDLVGEESGADAEGVDKLIPEETDGLFGALAGSVSGIAPALGGAAVLATAPGSGSDAGALFSSGSSGNANPEMTRDEPEQQQQGSVLARNASSLRNGGRPDPEGVQQASPGQEAAGAQASAAEAQQQYAGAGGANPFVPSAPSTPQTPQAPQAPVTTQQEVPSTEQAGLQSVGTNAPTSPPGLTSTSGAGDAPVLASGHDIPFVAGSGADSVSSTAWPQGFAGATLLEVAPAF